MPNGGGTEDRVGATLNGAFALNQVLSSGKRLPAGGKVDFLGLRGADGPHRDARLVFRVVSAAFDGLSNSERTSLVNEALLDGARTTRQSALYGRPLLGACIRPTGRAEGEFVINQEVVVIDAKTHGEIGEEAPFDHHTSSQTVEARPTRTVRPNHKPTDKHHLSARRHRGLHKPRSALGRLSGDRRRWLPTDSSGRKAVRLFRHDKILWIAPIALLVAALLPLPGACYTFLRLSVCAASLFLAYQHFVHEDAIDKWVILLGAVAILYNPLVPIYLTREIWTVLNLITAAFFALHLRLVKEHLRNSSDS